MRFAATRVLMGLLLVGWALHAPAEEAADASHAARYQRLLRQVVAGSAELRRVFADVALGALIGANRDEIARAGSHAWGAGALRYVEGLERARARLPQVEVVDVVPERAGVVRLVLDEEQVMLSAPRVGAQAAFDSRVAAVMCRIVDCSAPPDPLIDAARRAAREVRREWIFGDRTRPVLSASDGLACMFTDVRHLQLKERACEQVMGELRLVVAGLRAVLQHGGTLDWNALEIRAVPGGPAEVRHAADGSFFHAELPRLGHDPVLWREAIPWWQSRLRGYAGSYMIRAPEHAAHAPAGP